MGMKGDITEFSKDLRTINNFIFNKHKTIKFGSPSKKEKRNTFSPTINQEKIYLENTKDLEPIKECPKPLHRKTYSCGNLALTPQRISTKLAPKLIRKKWNIAPLLFDRYLIFLLLNYLFKYHLRRCLSHNFNNYIVVESYDQYKL